MSVTTIVLADDQQLVRQGVRRLLESEPGLKVVGEEADGLRVAALVERLDPDVLILDLMLPGLNGLEVIRQVTRQAPRTRVLVLSAYRDEGHVVSALRNGAAGYVLKHADASELLVAIREVAAGRRYLGPPLADRAVEAYVERAVAGPVDRYDTLTARERQILQLSAEGARNAEIAARLSISVRTAETHRANVMRKLGLRSGADVVRYAVSRGLIR